MGFALFPHTEMTGVFYFVRICSLFLMHVLTICSLFLMYVFGINIISDYMRGYSFTCVSGVTILELEQ